MLWLSKRCIIIRKREMFNLCDILLHHMNYSIWGILSRTELTNIGILVLLNSHHHSNLDIKTDCDHQIHSHICNNVELPPMVNPLPPLTTLSPFLFQQSWLIVRLSYHPSSCNNNNNKCKWSSGGACFLQMIIWRGPSLANDHPEEPASYKWSPGGISLLQMIIWRSRCLANDHPEGSASCKWSLEGTSLSQTFIWRGKWSSGGISLLQMIIWRGQCLANDHPEGSASCKWSFEGASLL